MNGRNSYHFRESMSLLLRTKWIGPYLLIPPLLAFMVYAEAFLAAHGMAGINTLGRRAVLAIWNGSFLMALIAGIKSCLFFSRLWGSDWFRNSLALPVSRPCGYWGPYLAVLIVASAVFVLTSGAVAAALPDSGRFPMFQLIGEAYLPVLWAVSMGAFMGIITTGTGGAVFLASFLILGFISGLPMVDLPGWLRFAIPPMGRLMTVGFRYPQALVQAVVLMAHSAVFLFLGRILYGAGIRRR